MGAPEEVTVEQVVKRETWTGNDQTPMLTYELLFSGDGRTYKWVKPEVEDPGFEAGQQVKGWRNPDGKFGVATGRPPASRSTSQTGSNNGRRDDATGESIERQVAGKVTAEMFSGRFPDLGPEELAISFQMMFKAVHASIAGQPDAS